MKINENLLFTRACFYQNLKTNFGHGPKTGEARIATIIQSKLLKENTCAPDARAKKKKKIAGEGLTGPPLMGKGRRPHVYEGRARARARAR